MLQISAIYNATLLHCKLKSVVARITTHLKHCHTTKFVVASWKNLLKKSRRQFNLLQHAASTCNNEILLREMFEVGGNTCNNDFQLATQQCCVKVEGKCCPYYWALRSVCISTIIILIAIVIEIIMAAKWLPKDHNAHWFNPHMVNLHRKSSQSVFGFKNEVYCTTCSYFN